MGMKKIILALCVGVAVIFCACAAKNVDKREAEILDTSVFQYKPIEDTVVIAEDIDLSTITEEPENTILAMIGEGVVYSRTEEDKDGTIPCTFYLYLFESKDTIELGTIYNWSYGMGEILVNNRLYIPRVCQLSPKEQASSWIIELDLEERAMSVISKAKNRESLYSRNMQGFGKHLILQQTEKEFQQLIAYDTETKELIGLKKYKHDSQNSMGEWISAFDVGSDSLSVLVKSMDESGREEYRIEVYDSEIKMVETIDVTDMTEWRQGAFDFEYEGGYLIYSDINHSGLIGKIEDQELDVIRSFESTSFYLMSETSECIQYKMWLNQQEKMLYRFDMLNGVLGKAELSSGYSEEIFLSVKRYSENIIILHEKLFNQNEGDEYRYILVEELDFLTVE